VDERSLLRQVVVNGDTTKQLGTCEERVSVDPMGNSQGRDNVRKRAARRKKTERLALAKSKKKAAK
jgi:hypothetical protein